jgi:hypothetical protein
VPRQPARPPRPRLAALALLFTALSALLVAFPRPAHSQVLLALLFGDKIASEKFHLGIDVGAQFSDQANLGGDEVRTTFAAGVVADYKLSDRLYLYGEIMGLSKMGSNGLSPVPTGNSDLDTFLSGSDMAVQLQYISVPVLLKYGFSENRFLVGLGGEIGFLTGAKNSYSGSTNSVGDYTYSQDVKDLYNSTDAGFAFLLEYVLHRKLRPSIQLQGYIGLTDILKDNPGDAITNRALTLSLVIPLLGHGSVASGSGSETSGTTSSSSKR